MQARSKIVPFPGPLAAGGRYTTGGGHQCGGDRCFLFPHTHTLTVREGSIAALAAAEPGNMVAQQTSGCFGGPLAWPTVPMRQAPVSRSVSTLPTLPTRFPQTCRRRWAVTAATAGRAGRVVVSLYKNTTRKLLRCLDGWRGGVICTRWNKPIVHPHTFDLGSGLVRIRGTGAGADRGLALPACD